jgi:hypothetical protein
MFQNNLRCRHSTKNGGIFHTSNKEPFKQRASFNVNRETGFVKTLSHKPIWQIGGLQRTLELNERSLIFVKN